VVAPRLADLRRSASRQSLTRAPVDDLALLTLFSSSSVWVVRRPSALVNYTPHPGLPTPPADTRRVRLRASQLRLSASSGKPALRRDWLDSRRRLASVCACTFYLVFKEPEFLTVLPCSNISFRRTF
jgi:hypothetical protein